MDSVRSIVGGSKRRVVASILVLLVLTVAVGVATGLVGMPSVESVDNRFGTVTDETTEIRTTISVRNPNPFGIDLSGTAIRYNISANGVPLAAGKKGGISVKPGDSTVKITTRMKNERIPDWWVSHLQHGERSTMTVDATVDVGFVSQSLDTQQRKETETDILSEFNTTEPQPVNANKEPVVQDPILVINERVAEWGSVSEAETPIEMEFVAHNPQQVQPVTVTTVGYDISMNGIRVGSGEIEQNRVIPGGETKRIPLTTVIDNSKLDEWWVSHLERNQVTQLKVRFYMEVELQDGETIHVPMDALTVTDTIETDILGSKPAPDEYTENSGGETGTPTDSSGGDGTSDGGTATPEPTLTVLGAPDSDGGSGNGTATPTPTATPTDDGLL